MASGKIISITGWILVVLGTLLTFDVVGRYQGGLVIAGAILLAAERLATALSERNTR